MNWVMLYAAIALEIAGTTSLKLSEGLAKPAFFVLALAIYSLSFLLLALSLKVLPIGVAYAIWSGLGTAVVALIGFTVFREPITVLRLIFLVLIVIGCVGLNLVTSPGPKGGAA